MLQTSLLKCSLGKGVSNIKGHVGLKGCLTVYWYDCMTYISQQTTNKGIRSTNLKHTKKVNQDKQTITNTDQQNIKRNKNRTQLIISS